MSSTRANSKRRLASTSRDGSDGTRTRDLRRDRPAFYRLSTTRPARTDDRAELPQAAHAAFTPPTRTASVLQASAFLSDVTVFRLNATAEGQSGSESTFRRNTAEHAYRIEAAHNPEVAGSNPAPATAKGAGNGAFLASRGWCAPRPALAL